MKKIVFFLHLIALIHMKSNSQTTYSYLALGDSYTIGEGVPIQESFPYLLVQQLRVSGYAFHAPEIIAKTGWTTDELTNGIGQTKLQKPYDLVTLLIGVNNQYRGRSPEEYELQFTELIKMALDFSGNKPERVVVLSIPDWGVTPFAEGRDRQKIASEIDAFNRINEKISRTYHTQYVPVTKSTRDAAGNPEMFAEDKLHPSGKEYEKWAKRITHMIVNMIPMDTHER
jgi:lysophospholipase L1-like esterase